MLVEWQYFSLFPFQIGIEEFQRFIHSDKEGQEGIWQTALPKWKINFGF